MYPASLNPAINTAVNIADRSAISAAGTYLQKDGAVGDRGHSRVLLGCPAAGMLEQEVRAAGARGLQIDEGPYIASPGALQNSMQQDVRGCSGKSDLLKCTRQAQPSMQRNASVAALISVSLTTLPWPS